MGKGESVLAARRRVVFVVPAGAALALAAGGLRAQALSAISGGDQAGALRAALEQGARQAVETLGRADGFWSNSRVRIPLPDALERLRSPARLMGMGGQFDALQLSMNRAAEQAVPQAMSLLQSAIRSMSVQDAQAILTGGPTAATEFFRTSSSAGLEKVFLPVVTQATEKVGLAQQYNALAERGASIGVVDAKQARLEPWVTRRALDGLFLMIGEEERKIRANPAGAATDLARRVFGAAAR
ncbi:MAG: DUF4197 domain-containing protein [Pseudomonadota bacterium]|jgi:hypothetical protein